MKIKIENKINELKNIEKDLINNKLIYNLISFLKLLFFFFK
jgi:hypothetical protein